MGDVEFESFLTKFKTLSMAGVKANFNAETTDGKLKVSLTAEIGSLSNNGFSPIKKYRGPSYMRRQERRLRERTSVTSNEEARNSTNAAAVAASVVTDPLKKITVKKVDHTQVKYDLSAGTDVERTGDMLQPHDDVIQSSETAVGEAEPSETGIHIEDLVSKEDTAMVSTDNTEEFSEVDESVTHSPVALEKHNEASSIGNDDTQKIIVAKPALITIHASAVIENSPYAEFMEEEWQSLNRFIISKEHLQKNVASVRHCESISSESPGGRFRHVVRIQIDVRTESLWETPRSYLWRHIGQENSWNRSNGTIITLTRIHQK